MKNIRTKIILICLGFFATSIGVTLLVLNLSSDNQKNQVEEISQPQIKNDAEPQKKEPEPITPPPPSIDGPALQKILDNFETSESGRLSVVIYDLKDEKELAVLNKEHVYFSASLYKLYLGFLAYQDIDRDLLKSNQILIKHPSYGLLGLNTCLNLMIQISDSFCGEAVLAIYNHPAAQKRLAELNLPNTNIASFLVSAEDMMHLLKLIYQGDGLSSDSQEQILESLAKQTYSQILRQTFSDISEVYDKMGYSEMNWHDIGIIEFKNHSRPLIIVILSEDISLQNLQALAREIKQNLLTNFEI